MANSPKKRLPAKQIIAQMRLRVATIWKKISLPVARFIDSRPLLAFFCVLGLLLIIIMVGNFIRKPKPAPEEKPRAPKAVEVFSIGENPTIQVSAKVEKSGVITLVAQTSGVIQKIQKQEGDTVNRGENLFWLSSNYQGGSIASVSRQIAQKNLDFVESTYDAQKATIQKQREIAAAANTQSDKLREITTQSADQTQNVINLNNEILTSIDAQIQMLEATNVGGINDSIILQTKQAKAGILTGQNALSGSLNNARYTSSSDNEPAQLANMTQDLTNQQLNLQEHSVDLNREMSRLNLTLAQISESLMYPTSPVSGTVERIWVHVGQSVNPGQTLATITGNKNTATAVALVSEDLARHISRIQLSRITLSGQTIKLFPRYISTEPTDGSLYSIFFTIPDEYSQTAANNEYVAVEMPVGTQQSASAVPFVPIDALYQTQTDAYVFVASASANNIYTVQSQPVSLGNVTGSYVQIKNGLHSGDQVIVDRSILAGDRVTIK